MQATVRPLFFWQTIFWAGMHSCYSSGKRMDLVNLSQRLALCLVMLALLPAETRSNRSARAQAFAREGRRAAKHSAAKTESQHIFFQAYPASTLPAQRDEPSHKADVNSRFNRSGPAHIPLQDPNSVAGGKGRGKLLAPTLSAVPSLRKSGDVRAGTRQGGRQGTREKRKAGPGGTGGVSCKVPRLSETQVRCMMEWCWYIRLHPMPELSFSMAR
jgi:hypothetical protein